MGQSIKTPEAIYKLSGRKAYVHRSSTATNRLTDGKFEKLTCAGRSPNLNASEHV